MPNDSIRNLLLLLLTFLIAFGTMCLKNNNLRSALLQAFRFKHFKRQHTISPIKEQETNRQEQVNVPLEQARKLAQEELGFKINYWEDSVDESQSSRYWEFKIGARYFRNYILIIYVDKFTGEIKTKNGPP